MNDVHNIVFNLSCRGSSGSETLYTPNNGKFLSSVQLPGKFDNIMTKYLRRIVNNTIVYYFGKQIQNELIFLLGSEIQNDI